VTGFDVVGLKVAEKNRTTTEPRREKAPGAFKVKTKAGHHHQRIADEVEDDLIRKTTSAQ